MPLRDYDEKQLLQEDPVVFLEKKIRMHPSQYEPLDKNLVKKYLTQLHLKPIERDFIHLIVSDATLGCP